MLEVKSRAEESKSWKTSFLVLARAKKKVTTNRKVPKKGSNVPIKDFGTKTKDRLREET